VGVPVGTQVGPEPGRRFSLGRTRPARRRDRRRSRPRRGALGPDAGAGHRRQPAAGRDSGSGHGRQAPPRGRAVEDRPGGAGGGRGPGSRLLLGPAGRPAADRTPLPGDQLLDGDRRGAAAGAVRGRPAGPTGVAPVIGTAPRRLIPHRCRLPIVVVRAAVPVPVPGQASIPARRRGEHPRYGKTGRGPADARGSRARRAVRA
jgi:hypothetical protein